MSMDSSPNAGGDGSNNAGGGGGDSGGCCGPCGCGPCGACKFLRRKCLPSCIFAPYFDPDNGASHFASVHKIFGASNVSKLLQTIPIHMRTDAVVTIIYEAQARMRDPIYGCVSHIFTLQRQITHLQTELTYLQAQLAELPQPLAPPTLQQPAMATSMAATYDLSSLFYPMPQQSPRNMMQLRAMDLCYQYASGGSTLASASGGGSGSGVVSSVGAAAAGGGSGGDGGGVGGVGADDGGGDLHTLARELIHRLGNASAVSAPGVAGTSTNASLSPSSAK